MMPKLQAQVLVRKLQGLIDAAMENGARRRADPKFLPSRQQSN